MMINIQIYDTTLRDGEQTPGVHFGPRQKLDIAKRLAKTGVDVIEAGFPASSPGDAAAVAGIAEASGNGELRDVTVSALARMRRDDVDAAAAAVKGAKRSRLHVFIATSDIHLEYKLKISREEALERIRDCVSYGANLTREDGTPAFDEIEFSAEDATRTDPDFLCEAVRRAADCGAGIVNIPDTVGYTTPDEFRRILRDLREKVPGDYRLSVHCHNDLGMAVANSLAAAECGAEQIECTVNGLGERAGNAAMEEIVMALRVRRDVLTRGGEEMGCRIDPREITETSRLVASVSGIAVAPNKAVVGSNAFAHASGIHQHGVMSARGTYEIMKPEEIGLTANTIVLGKLSGRHAFADRTAQLGYTLDAAGIDASFARFKEIADKKSVMTDDDIRAIVGEYLDSREGKYYLETFQIQSGNHIRAMALVSLIDKESEEADGGNRIVTEAAPGEGPIDAAFNAVNRIAGADGTVGRVELISYGITAVTEGTDALGEAKVKIRDAGQGTEFSGRGVSTDVIKASIKAYLGAINKWRANRNEC
ncbi:MAG: 2-isopropylmalate synthase [Ruminococcaceae bacterium]|nr:2-isopropylmalate synthase [Oscillospiraceae bacterium]